MTDRPYDWELIGGGAAWQEQFSERELCFVPANPSVSKVTSQPDGVRHHWKPLACHSIVTSCALQALQWACGWQVRQKVVGRYRWCNSIRMKTPLASCSSNHTNRGCSECGSRSSSRLRSRAKFDTYLILHVIKQTKKQNKWPKEHIWLKSHL